MAFVPQTGVFETRDELVLKILQLWGTGPSAKALMSSYDYVAAITGVSKMTVMRILKAEGKI